MSSLFLLGCVSFDKESDSFIPDIRYTALSESQYWILMEHAALASNKMKSSAIDPVGKTEAQFFADALLLEFSCCSAQALEDFYRYTNENVKELYSWIHFSAAWIICGRLTPREFYLYRLRILALGKESYSTAVSYADSLALSLPDRFNPNDWEEVHQVVFTAYLISTGEKLAMSGGADYNISGKKIEPDKIRQYLPKLIKRFSDSVL